ncbi:DUF5615 family PIN-like protein [Salinibacter ruber]|uniref:DUF5615 family PIN-like protein n=1 Tax=Salinibacter ruber TaxID=146919 RepID=UPI0009D94CFC
MDAPAKFLADMGISPETVAWLREQGHGAVHLMDRGAQQAQDPDILKWARDEERVLRVHDLDFSELVVAWLWSSAKKSPRTSTTFRPCASKLEARWKKPSPMRRTG